jgi:hypothetical protein
MPPHNVEMYQPSPFPETPTDFGCTCSTRDLGLNRSCDPKHGRLVLGPRAKHAILRLREASVYLRMKQDQLADLTILRFQPILQISL